jgi:hypothetical protein
VAGSVIKVQGFRQTVGADTVYSIRMSSLNRDTSARWGEAPRDITGVHPRVRLWIGKSLH